MMLLFWGKIIGKVISFACSIIGVIWTALEIAEHFFAGWQLIAYLSENIWAFIGPAIAGGIGCMIYQLKNEIFPTHKFKDKLINVRIGNILKKTRGNIIIGINEQLETSEKFVAPSSIHMQLLKENKKNIEELKQVFSQHKGAAYPKNIFFQGNIGGKAVIFLVMSSLKEPGVAYATVPQVKDGLQALFSHQQELYIKNGTVYCPLLGNGESGISLSPEETIRMIVKVYLEHCQAITPEVTDKIKKLKIIVHRKNALSVDWVSLNREIRFMIEKCQKCEGLKHFYENGF